MTFTTQGFCPDQIDNIILVGQIIKLGDFNFVFVDRVNNKVYNSSLVTSISDMPNFLETNKNNSVAALYKKQGFFDKLSKFFTRKKGGKKKLKNKRKTRKNQRRGSA